VNLSQLTTLVGTSTTQRQLVFWLPLWPPPTFDAGAPAALPPVFVVLVGSHDGQVTAVSAVATILGYQA
jgi:hypothetical protein